MATKDLTIFESGTGAEISLLSGDISFSERIYYKVYISLFGGNTEASTKGNENEGEEREDWWGNSLFFPQEPAKQYNSETEKTLRSVALNSAGRLKILEAAKSDLKLFKNISQTDINVVILSSDSVAIEVKIQEPSNNSSVLIKMVWDNAKNEVITNFII